MATNKPASKPLDTKAANKGAETIKGAETTKDTQTATAADVGNLADVVDVNKANATTIVSATPKTKIANAIFEKAFALPENERPARKDMIKAAMDAAGISQPCAATYLQNFKRRNGLDKTGLAKMAAAPAA